jgi:hypothetical protein
MNYKLVNFLKLFLATTLFLCLLDMPYSYFQFVRFASTAGFAYLAYEAYEQKNQRDLIIFIVLALLFQPFEKIALGRVLWNIVDVGVAVYLIFKVIDSRKA